MKMARLFPLLALVLAVGCSGPAEKAADSTADGKKDVPSAKQIKVALLTPGPVSDSGWNALAYNGLQDIKTQLGADVQNQEAEGTKIKDSMRAYAQQGFDLVIGHGYEYNDPAMEVAKDFPKTIFISSSGGKTAPNVGAFRFYLEQSFFLAGMMAADMSKSGKVAMIGGPDVPSIRSTFKAFRAGATAEKPNCQVIEIFTGKDSDIAAAKQATLQAISQGADFVIHQANAAAQGVFDAAKEKGIYAFGANSDQNDNPSGVVIASPVIVAGPAFVDLAKKVQAGTYKGQVTLMGMDIGAIDFVINPKLKGKIPADVLKKIQDTQANIRSGKLVVPKMEF